MHDRRLERREPLALPLALDDGVAAFTRDISPGGLFLVVPCGHLPNDWVRVELTLVRSGLRLHALGEVRRIERLANGLGVALQLYRQRLSPSR